ncbi:hypothetical protein ACH42_07140 [Endozoicomonas sp. (ex Bugula neritina AB1)]|nr:hypothetical protein ACH42_07140 [Endozoicomonas sp. (ex Bugula neritina AB1)]
MSVICGADPEVKDKEIPLALQSIGGDAGFRHYYRIQLPDETLVAVNAPVETEDNHTFVHIAEAWRQGGVRVPEVKAVDYINGFMLLEDFGDTQLQSVLSDQNVDLWCQKAFATLKTIQQQSPESLLVYDGSLLHFELSIYSEWFLGDLLGLNTVISDLTALFSHLVETILQQPIGTVHRDFHSRNLMVVDQNELGVIDFQGALYGPLLYDSVSLLKDCYVRWPDEKINTWLQSFVSSHALLQQYDFEQVRQWFDLTGLQRHLKCLGIFSRLWLRDGKSGYLADIPRTFDYVIEVCRHYPELQHHALWLERHVQPILQQRLNAVQVEAGVI